MKASRVEVERTVKVRVLMLELEPKEAAALTRAIDRCIELSVQARNTLDVQRFQAFRHGLTEANDTALVVDVEPE